MVLLRTRSAPGGKTGRPVRRPRPLSGLPAISKTLRFCDAKDILYKAYANFLMAASTTCPTRTEVVTLPTPPGTGVMESTMGSTAA